MFKFVSIQSSSCSQQIRHQWSSRIRCAKNELNSNNRFIET